MKKKTLSTASILTWVVLTVLTATLSCKSDKDADPDPTAQLTGKWWCDNAKVLADQYFDADGTFQQRFSSNTETGKWKLSADKKTISVSEVNGNLFGKWTYTLKEVSATKLVMTYFDESTFSPCP